MLCSTVPVDIVVYLYLSLFLSACPSLSIYLFPPPPDTHTHNGSPEVLRISCAVVKYPPGERDCIEGSFLRDETGSLWSNSRGMMAILRLSK